MTRWRTIALAIVGAGCLAAIGAIAFAFVIAPSPPPSLADAEEITQVPVTQQEFRDDAGGMLFVTRAPDIEIRIRAEGLLTSTSCLPGAKMISGTSTFHVDGRPIVNLYTSFPLWRDLSVGDEGSDVAALKESLEALGYEAAEGDSLGWADLEALRLVFSKAGAEPDFDTVTTSRLIWLPAQEVSASNCEQSVGATVAYGDVVATTHGAATVSVTGLTETSLPGPRELVLDETAVALNDAFMPDAAGVATILGTSAYSLAVLESADKTTISIPIRLRLANPIAVAALPPAAVTSGSGIEACVTGDGKRIPARIVSSEMGQTIVQFDGKPPTLVSLSAPPSCS